MMRLPWKLVYLWGVFCGIMCLIRERSITIICLIAHFALHWGVLVETSNLGVRWGFRPLYCVDCSCSLALRLFSSVGLNVSSPFSPLRKTPLQPFKALFIIFMCVFAPKCLLEWLIESWYALLGRYYLGIVISTLLPHLTFVISRL